MFLQIEYRIRKSGGVCYGLFNSYRPDDAKDWWIATMKHSRPVESGRPDRAKHIMFAHIIATLGKHPVITDDDMAFPEKWRDPAASKGSTLGHQSSGRTICLHSFAVCPEVQGVGIGKTAMKSYLQLMNESGMADRVALICKPVSLLTSLCSDIGILTIPVLCSVLQVLWVQGYWPKYGGLGRRRLACHGKPLSHLFGLKSNSNFFQVLDLGGPKQKIKEVPTHVKRA